MPAQAANCNEFVYEIINDGANVKINYYTGQDTYVNIPAIIEGKEVTVVSIIGFLQSVIRGINIPKTVASMSYQSCMVPESVTTICDYKNYIYFVFINNFLK